MAGKLRRNRGTPGKSRATFCRWVAESNCDHERRLLERRLRLPLAFILGPTCSSPQEPPRGTRSRSTVRSGRLAGGSGLHGPAEMARRHRNLYHTVSRERFDSAVAALDRRIPSLARHQVIVELARIVGPGGRRPHQHRANPRSEDRVPDPAGQALLLQGRPLRPSRQTGRTPTWPAPGSFRSGRQRRSRPTPGAGAGRADNEMDARFFAPFLLAMPEVLHALGSSVPTWSESPNS